MSDNISSQQQLSLTIDQSCISETSELLGGGAYGSVYAAKYHGTPVAIKKMHPILCKHSCKQFYDEAKQMKSFAHPCILPCYGAYCNDNLPCSPIIVMERQWMSLHQFIVANNECVEDDLKLRLLHDVACGLCYLHANNIMHRDLTPMNILVTDDCHAKVSDFGQAKHYDPKRRMTTCPGNSVYMPPEALRSNTVYTYTLDVFSYGVVFIFTMTGQVPECSDAYLALDATHFQKVKEAERRKLSINKLKDQNHKIFVHSCLEDDPADRPDSKSLGSIISKFMEKLPSDVHRKLLATPKFKLCLNMEERCHSLEVRISELETENKERTKEIEVLTDVYKKARNEMSYSAHDASSGNINCVNQDGGNGDSTYNDDIDDSDSWVTASKGLDNHEILAQDDCEELTSAGMSQSEKPLHHRYSQQPVQATSIPIHPSQQSPQQPHHQHLSPAQQPISHHQEQSVPDVVHEYNHSTIPNKEVCHFTASKREGAVSSQIFDHHGGTLYIEVTITVPKFAVSEGDKVEIQASSLPDGCDPNSVFVWIGADYKFKKPVKVTVPRFAVINEISDLFVLTASARDVVKVEKENFQCSKCLARSRSFSRSRSCFSRVLSLSPSRELPHTVTTTVTVFFCVPEDYATADEMLIELCVCYDLKCCMETAEESYSQRKMLSKKSAIVNWNVTIDCSSCQKFSLSFNDCPGWKIDPIGSDKLDVSDLNFHTCQDRELLKVKERLYLYPPRFKVSVNRLCHGRNLETKFKIMLESNDASLSHEFKQFPLTILQLDGQVAPEIHQIADPDCPAGNSATATNMICPLSAADSSIVLSEAKMGSNSLARANMGSNLLSTLPVAGNTFNVTIFQGDVSIGSPPEHSIAGAGNKFNSLQSFATVLSNVDVATILPYLVTHGLLTQGQLGYLNFANYTTVQKQEKLTSILLGLDEKGVEKFLQCLSETSDYEPHRQLLEDIQSKMAEKTDNESVV